MPETLTSPPALAPHALRIGPLTLPTRAIQAALSGYSDLPMRRVARAWGAAYTLAEVVLDQTVVTKGKLQNRILRVADDDHPVGAQLLGALPEQFAQAARKLVEAGYDVVDINFGCPVKKVLGRCRGGFLLSAPPAALEILSRVREVVPARVPLTLKMRRGMDDSAESRDCFWQILDGAWQIGVDAVCVHPRTVQQRYVGSAYWPLLAEVKKAYPRRTVFGSGDVFTAHDAVKMMAETGVDGVWVARGSIGAPWIFRQIERLLGTGTLGEPPNLVEQRSAIERHLREADAFYGSSRAAKIMRKFGIKYSEAHPAGIAVRDDFIACQTLPDLYRVLDRWYPMNVPPDHFGPVRHRVGPGDLIAAGACGT